MLITPSTLECARARRHDLEREARYVRLLRGTRIARAMGCGDAASLLRTVRTVGRTRRPGCVPTCAPTRAAA